MLDRQVLINVHSASTLTDGIEVFLEALLVEGDLAAMAFFVSLLSSAGFSDLLQTISLCPGTSCEAARDCYHGYGTTQPHRSRGKMLGSGSVVSGVSTCVCMRP